jgi:hypothetical protein
MLYLVVDVCHDQDQLEVDVSHSTKHRPMDRVAYPLSLKPWRNDNAVPVAGDGVPHQELIPLKVEE